jgi:beta-galactosidase
VSWGTLPIDKVMTMMTSKNRIPTVAAAALFFLAFFGDACAVQARTAIPLDANWRFAREDVRDAQNPAFDDSAWQKIALPHTYNAEDGEKGGAYYRGPAWYRDHVVLPGALASRRAYLQFDGAALAADVWVNGKFAGRHEGGYAAFRFDVTGLMQPGDNVIAVRVDNSKFKTIAPLMGDFSVFGGLYRPVRLVLTSALHIDMLDAGGPGIYATASDIGAASADISIVTRVTNDSAKPMYALVRCRVLDATGRQVATASSPVEIAPGATLAVEQHAQLREPHLWDGVRDPYLYEVVSEIFDAPSVLPSDMVAVPLGVRSFRVDPDKGFFLNGRHISVHGVDLFHSERPGKGTAVSDRDIDQDFDILRDLGVTGIRMVHFQHPGRAYDDADRAGLVVWTEIPLYGAVDPDPAFEANIRRQLRELVRQNYNHPSVFFWGLGNELYTSNADTNRVLAAVQDEAKKLDPTRPTTYAHCCQPDDDPNNASHSDVIGYNRYFGWYDGDMNDIGPWADKLHAALPHRAFAVSEYGAGASVHQEEDSPQRPTPDSLWHPEQYQAQFHETYWRALQSRPFVWGTFVWVAFDLASDRRHEGDRPGINDKGLVTYDRAVKKDAFFWYKAHWSDEPVLYIASRRDVLRKRDTVDIKIYSNLKKVALTINGKPLPAQAPDGRIALWRGVKLQPGDNVIVARGRKGNVLSGDAVTWRVVSVP